jgi:hypothetical protein
MRQGEKHGDHVEDGGGALLGAGHFDVLDIKGAGNGGADAASDEAQASGLIAESREEGRKRWTLACVDWRVESETI